jgi:hypothetical protein
MAQKQVATVSPGPQTTVERSIADWYVVLGDMAEPTHWTRLTRALIESPSATRYHTVFSFAFVPGGLDTPM